MSKRTMAGLVGCVALLAAQSAAAAPETHDGFFLRLGLGGAGLSADADVEGGSTIEVNGGSGLLDVAIGGIVAENLAVHGHIHGVTVTEPDVKLGGNASGKLDDTNFNASGVGAGVTYYVMPLNLYVSGSALFLQLSLTDKDGEEIARSDTGFGGVLQVGKEWWVSDDWGLGLAASVMGGSIKGETKNTKEEVEWTVLSYGLFFSATYN